jgi:NAD(P)-dependent dehydrogenase (short-subunit alcohol dehydrogenase family)
VEDWELEQAKLKRAGVAPPLQGRVARVTGGASGIGRACVDRLSAEGAAVAAVDMDDRVLHDFDGVEGVLPLVCDVGRSMDVEEAVGSTLRRFGGLDIVVSNAGVFPESATIAEMSDESWEQSLAVNLSGHRSLLQKSIPYLELGIDPAVVIVGSKNVAAPGVGAGAYSVAKAGLTQLARVAALELAASGIRVNVVHPNDVFDTAIWTDEVLAERARHYGMTVDEYRRRNLLRVEITSSDVAALVVAMAGQMFSRTTGAQLSIDGGTDRTI